MFQLGDIVRYIKDDEHPKTLGEIVLIDELGVHVKFHNPDTPPPHTWWCFKENLVLVKRSHQIANIDKRLNSKINKLFI